MNVQVNYQVSQIYTRSNFAEASPANKMAEVLSDFSAESVVFESSRKSRWYQWLQMVRLRNKYSRRGSSCPPLLEGVQELMEREMSNARAGPKTRSHSPTFGSRSSRSITSIMQVQVQALKLMEMTGQI